VPKGKLTCTSTPRVDAACVGERQHVLPTDGDAGDVDAAERLDLLW
jgi:hypothetical protein